MISVFALLFCFNMCHSIFVVSDICDSFLRKSLCFLFFDILLFITLFLVILFAMWRIWVRVNVFIGVCHGFYGGISFRAYDV